MSRLRPGPDTALLSGLNRMGAGVKRRENRRKIGEIRVVPDRRAHQRPAPLIEAVRERAKRQFPDEEHYVFPAETKTVVAFISQEDELTKTLEALMENATTTQDAEQLAFEF